MPCDPKGSLRETLRKKPSESLLAVYYLNIQFRPSRLIYKEAERQIYNCKSMFVIQESKSYFQARVETFTRAKASGFSVREPSSVHRLRRIWGPEDTKSNSPHI